MDYTNDKKTKSTIQHVIIEILINKIMLQEHLFSAKNNNHLYQRRYLGDGNYYQLGMCQGIQVDDEFYSFTNTKKLLKVTKIISRKDAKGVFANESDKKDAIYEAELHDDAFQVEPGFTYTPLNTI